MPLPAMVADLEQVPEAVRDEYVKDDDTGMFILQVDDKEFKSKLDEFRVNNRKLHQEKERLTQQMARFKDIDPEKYQEALEAKKRLEEIEEQKLIKEGDLDKVVEQRTAKMRENFEKQIQQVQQHAQSTEQERDQLKGRLGGLLIDNTVTAAVQNLGKVRRGAMDDIINRAHRTFKIGENGDPIAQDDTGNQKFDEKGNPLTIESWAQDLLANAPHLFEGGGGGGAGGGKNGGEPGVRYIDSNDPVAMGKHAKEIAEGKVKVRPGG